MVRPMQEIMKRIILFPWLLAAFICTDLFSQSGFETRNNFHDAESWILFEEYKEALPLYLQLLSKYPDNSNFKYRIGQCYINTPGEKEKAITYLEEAVRNIDPGYRAGKFRETGAPYDALYYLANAYRINNQLDKALETYALFKKNMDTKVYDSTIVDLQIESCLNAKVLMAVPVFIRKQNLGPVINERTSEFNPVISDDENLLVFSRSEPFYDALLYSLKINGQWTDPRNLNEILKVDRDLFPTSLSGDGKTLYLYSSADYDGNIYTTRLENNTWSPVVKLNENINTKYWESHATVSHDDKKLYFTSNRKGTIGGLDIFVSLRDSTGDWGIAQNLGPVINTPYNEESPFLSMDDRTLFFSSRGHFNMGGYDIFSSTLQDNGEWSAPENAGYPLNTTDDDIFFKPVKEGFEGYYSIDSHEGFGKQDIYRIEIFSGKHPRKFIVRGISGVADLLTIFKDSVKITIVNIKNPAKREAVYTNPATGEYGFNLPQGEYQLNFEGYGGKNVTRELKIPLTYPSDSFLIPETVLPRTDYAADLIVEGSRNISVVSGDTIPFHLKVEPQSVLTAEKLIGDSVVSSEKYRISNPDFIFRFAPKPGYNKIIFKLADRFNNQASEEVLITRQKKDYTVEKPAGRITAKVVNEPVSPALSETDPAIAVIKERILIFSEKYEKGAILRQAVEKEDQENILQRGAWLGAFFNESVKEGLTAAQLSEMFVIISAPPETGTDKYLAALINSSEEPLTGSLKAMDLKKYRIKSPEDLLLFLLTSGDRQGYPEDAVFRSVANLIAASNVTPEIIKSWVPANKPRSQFILWLGAGVLIIFLFMIFRRKRKKNEGRTEKKKN
jgi:tetratricopeptide (TPR) repeat protein